MDDNQKTWFSDKDTYYFIAFDSATAQFMLVNVSSEKIDATSSSFRKLRELLDMMGAKKIDVELDFEEEE